MHYLNFTNFETGYQDVLIKILELGHERVVRGNVVTKELSPLLLRTQNPLNNILTCPIRKTNKAFMIAEWLWMMNGLDSVDMVSHYNKNIASYSDDGKRFYGAYGPRLASQVQHILKTLQEDLHSRQAVLTTWIPNPQKTKDTPCTISMQFIVNDGKLDMVVNMRSNDAWLGLPYDLFNFTMIQAFVAFKLKLQVGYYNHFAGSMHLYEQHLDLAREVVKRPVYVSDILQTAPILTNELHYITAMEQDLRNKVDLTDSSFMMTRPWSDFYAYLHSWARKRHQEK